MTEPTMTLLEKDGSFNFVQRDFNDLPEKLNGRVTYWLIGRNNQGGGSYPSGGGNNSEHPNGGVGSEKEDL